jgi:hypothetical protein
MGARVASGILPVGGRETPLRWVALSLGLALAGAILYLVVSGTRGGPGRGGDAPPLDQIDDDSRARLERVLREADEPEERRP